MAIGTYFLGSFTPQQYGEVTRRLEAAAPERRPGGGFTSPSKPGSQIQYSTSGTRPRHSTPSGAALVHSAPWG
jgi:hypothetical protein